jgi:UDP-3-O-[3-hydroxymyristoyl] glucosamine N-acyltransferase
VSVPLRAPVSAGWLCERLGLPLLGPDRPVAALCTLETLTEDGLSFVLPGRPVGPLQAGTIVGFEKLGGDGASVIASASPRLDFIRAQYEIERGPGFALPSAPPELHPSVLVGPGAVIEPGVAVGEGSIVGPNAVLRSGTRVGRFCEIKSGAVVGDVGFGFERDREGRPLRMMHLGGVRLGDHVEVGALTTVVRGALGDTVLEDYVKVNDHVHIAHNCRIGEATIIGACADLCGSLKVGKRCWIAPNCSIRQKLSIGDGAVVGMGAVVVKDVPAGVTVIGNPARPAA